MIIVWEYMKNDHPQSLLGFLLCQNCKVVSNKDPANPKPKPPAACIIFNGRSPETPVSYGAQPTPKVSYLGG